MPVSRTTWSLPSAWSAPALAALVACSGTVVVDEAAQRGDGAGSPTGDGSGASGPGPSGPGPSGSATGAGAASQAAATSGGPGAGGGSVVTSCEAACDAIAGCAASGCLASCQTANPNCSFAFDPFLACIAAEVDPATCDLPDPCVEPLLLWLECESWCTDGGSLCMGDSSGSCACFLDACGPVAQYETSCEGLGNGLSACTCFADGRSVGKCLDEAKPSCDPLVGCCATLFFVPG